MQERAYGGSSLALKRHLNTLAGGFEKGRLSFDLGVVLKSGAKLVREWRGHAHTVLVLVLRHTLADKPPRLSREGPVREGGAPCVDSRLRDVAHVEAGGARWWRSSLISKCCV
jgi:hypothetical protein